MDDGSMDLVRMDLGTFLYHGPYFRAPEFLSFSAAMNAMFRRVFTPLHLFNPPSSHAPILLSSNNKFKSVRL